MTIVATKHFAESTPLQVREYFQRWLDLRTSAKSDPQRCLALGQEWLKEANDRREAEAIAFAGSAVAHAQYSCGSVDAAMAALRNHAWVMGEHVGHAARACRELTLACVYAGHVDERLALKYSFRALKAARASGDHALVMHCLLSAGIIEINLRRTSSGHTLNAVLSGLRNADDGFLRMHALCGLAFAKFVCGQYVSGAKYALQAQDMAEAAGRTLVVVDAQMAHAVNLAGQAKVSAAERVIERPFPPMPLSGVHLCHELANRTELYMAAAAYSQARECANKLLDSATRHHLWAHAMDGLRILDVLSIEKKRRMPEVDPQLRKLVQSGVSQAKPQLDQHF